MAGSQQVPEWSAGIPAMQPIATHLNEMVRAINSSLGVAGVGTRGEQGRSAGTALGPRQQFGPRPVLIKITQPLNNGLYIGRIFSGPVTMSLTAQSLPGTLTDPGIDNAQIINAAEAGGGPPLAAFTWVTGYCYGSGTDANGRPASLCIVSGGTSAGMVQITTPQNPAVPGLYNGTFFPYSNYLNGSFPKSPAEVGAALNLPLNQGAFGAMVLNLAENAVSVSTMDPSYVRMLPGVFLGMTTETAPRAIVAVYAPPPQLSPVWVVYASGSDGAAGTSAPTYAYDVYTLGAGSFGEPAQGQYLLASGVQPKKPRPKCHTTYQTAGFGTAFLTPNLPAPAGATQPNGTNPSTCILWDAGEVPTMTLITYASGTNQGGATTG